MAGTESNIPVRKTIADLWFFFIPSLYFFRSRLNNLQALLYHGYNEWLAGIFIIVYFRDVSPVAATFDYITGFLAFIALYETGYLVNDYYSVKQEENPRERSVELGRAGMPEFLGMILVRIVFFVVFAHLADLFTLNYIVFSVLMVITFGLHNFIKEKEIKFVTFVGLSVFRFILPLFPFVKPDDLRVILPAVLLNYSLYRTINYLDSKDLLHLKNKKEGWFKVSFYLLLLPLSVVFTVVYENPFGLLLNFFFLFFWGVFLIKERIKI